MTDFMTAPPVILVQPTCPGGQREKGVHFQLTCNLCPESHKTQVWLCFLILSCLSTSTCADAVPHLDHLQTCLNDLKPSIEKSDAMLYAPSANNVKENCKKMSLKCYMLELIMVISENEYLEDKLETKCILEFNESLLPEAKVGCPCEIHSQKNITIFLERLSNLLKEMNALGNT
uniref:interleukin-15 n=1 Tax=Semicossyphus pulcher TaxID=241346 RepID=UPI0037E6FFAB